MAGGSSGGDGDGSNNNGFGFHTILAAFEILQSPGDGNNNPSFSFPGVQLLTELVDLLFSPQGGDRLHDRPSLSPSSQQIRAHAEMDAHAYNGVYQSNSTEIRLNNFEENHFYAFAAKWDINQHVNDFCNDDLQNTGERELPRSLGTKDDENNHHPCVNSGSYDEDKMLHLQLGSSQSFNLVELMYLHDTDFIGIFFPDGFTNATLFIPDSNHNDAIELSISEVLISTGEKTSRFSIFSLPIFHEMYQYLTSFEYNDFLNFMH